MNLTILMGRLTRDPEVRYTTDENPKAVARYTLAVDRRYGNDGENNADFIRCVAFDKKAEFAEKYLHKGTKVLVTGRIQTGSYTNRDGQNVYTVEVIIGNCEFAESKNNSEGYQHQQGEEQQILSSLGDGFMNIPDGIDEELPFN